jgi:radical SAM superfamily enzyme YgiQ (UPF0313 family)
VLYVEASRGCPFKCAFCLSALDKTAWAFDADRFLGELDGLFRRGARNFKFVDRTFNLKIDAALRSCSSSWTAARRGRAGVVRAFRGDSRPPAGAAEGHDRAFSAGVLQFEVGVQTFNPCRCSSSFPGARTTRAPRTTCAGWCACRTRICMPT